MKKELTEIVFILDRSGSMSGLESDTIGGFNSMIERQKQEELVQKALNQYYAYNGHYPDLDPISDEPEDGASPLTDEKKEYLHDRLHSVTAVRIDTEPYDFFYDQAGGTICLERKAG